MSDKKYTSIKHDNAAGRVEFKGGKAVWQWAQEQNDSTSILLKSLDNPELELEKTRRTPISRPQQGKPPAKRGAKPEAQKSSAEAKDDDNPWGISSKRGSGFDPYNRS